MIQRFLPRTIDVPPSVTVSRTRLCLVFFGHKGAAIRSFTIHSFFPLFEESKNLCDRHNSTGCNKWPTGYTDRTTSSVPSIFQLGNNPKKVLASENENHLCRFFLQRSMYSLTKEIVTTTEKKIFIVFFTKLVVQGY